MEYQVNNSIWSFHTDVKVYDDFVHPIHLHKSHEIAYVSEGRCSVRVDNTSVVMEEGEVAFILSNQPHSYETVGHSKIWVCVFSEDFITDFSEEMRHAAGETFVFSADEHVRSIIEEAPLSLYRFKSLLYELCHLYKTDNLLTFRENSMDLLTYKIIDYISLHYRENITLESCAAALGYEMHYLSRYFNKTIGMGFSELINIYRTDYAKHLLTSQEMKVTDVSEKSGFSTIRNFNYVFKSLTGMTPREYRKKMLTLFTNKTR